MTTAVKTLALANIEDTTLAQLFPANTNGNFPYLFQLNTDTFFIAENANTAGNFQSVDYAALAQDSTIELVVFDQLTCKQLNNICQQCQVNLLSLTAINHRNNATSYRFNVEVLGDLTLARQQLVQFNLDQKQESILIQNAPKLAKPGVLLMDMDSTTIKIECIDELAVLAGVGEEVAEVTELAMQGKLDFAQSLHSRVATLKDAPISILETVKANLPLMEGLEKLVSELQKHHWRVAIASGGFTYFADHLKDKLSLDSAKANELEIIDNKLTGKVLGEVVDANAKAENLLSLASEHKIADSQTVAMGDGANDLVMMDAAALGVAFHAKQLVVDKADVGINHLGLDCLLHWLA
ncbi:MAG: phosphoserine phosphatase SerB [Thalassotalea sp.]